MNRHRLWIWVVLTATAAAICTIQLCRFRSGGALFSWGRSGGKAAVSSDTEDPAPVYEFSLSADESRAFCRTNRYRIEIRDVPFGETLDTLDFRGKLPIMMSTTSKDDMVLVGYGDGSLVLWSIDAESGRHRPRLLGHEPSIACCALSRDGRLAATGQDDGTVILRDARSGTRRHRLQAHAGTVSCVRFSPDGMRLLSARRTVCLWDVPTGNRLALVPARGPVLGAAELSPDGRFVISASRNWGGVVMWNLEAATELWRAGLEKRTPTAVAFRPDQRIVAVGDSVGEVWLYESRSGRRIAMLPDTTGIVSRVRFSADGARLYISRQNGSIRMWDVKRYAGD